MDALDALKTRVSCPRLEGEIPDRIMMENLFHAALRVPDHGQLRPWRFLLISGSGRERLGDLFAKAQRQDDPELSDVAVEKARQKPSRAPLIIVIITTPKTHPKVPEIEQLLSAGASVQNMLVAAHAQGLGAMWRTGGMAYHPTVMDGLGLEENEKIVGFLYVGEISGKTRSAPELDAAQYFAAWP